MTNYKDNIYYVLSLTRGGTNNRATIWADGIRASMLEYKGLTPPSCPYDDWQTFKMGFTQHFTREQGKPDTSIIPLTDHEPTT